MILKRLSKLEFSDPVEIDERRGQRVLRPLNCGRRGLEQRICNPSRRVFEDEEFQDAEMGDLIYIAEDGTEGKADLSVVMLHIADDEQAILQELAEERWKEQ